MSETCVTSETSEICEMATVLRFKRHLRTSTFLLRHLPVQLQPRPHRLLLRASSARVTISSIFRLNHHRRRRSNATEAVLEAAAAAADVLPL